MIPPGDSLEVTVEYTPVDIGQDVGSITVNAVGPCIQSAVIQLRGEGVRVCLDTHRDTILFIADSCAINPAPLDSTVIVSNCGGIDIDQVDISDAALQRGSDAQASTASTNVGQP